MTKAEVKSELEILERKIRVMEWDKARDQINPGKMAMLDGLKKQKADMQQKYNEMPEDPVVKKEKKAHEAAPTQE